MSVWVRRKPQKLTLVGITGLLLSFGAIYFAVDSTTFRIILLWGLGSALVIVFVKSLLDPLLGGVFLSEGRIEGETVLGGVDVVRVDDLDPARCSLDDAGLLLVTHQGRRLQVSIAEFARQDIIRIAEYAGIERTARVEM